MSDIVKDLRSECYPEQYSGWSSLCSDAADEIELLRAALRFMAEDGFIAADANAGFAQDILDGIERPEIEKYMT